MLSKFAAAPSNACLGVPLRHRGEGINSCSLTAKPGFHTGVYNHLLHEAICETTERPGDSPVPNPPAGSGPSGKDQPGNSVLLSGPKDPEDLGASGAQLSPLNRGRGSGRDVTYWLSGSAPRASQAFGLGPLETTPMPLLTPCLPGGGQLGLTSCPSEGRETAPPHSDGSPKAQGYAHPLMPPTSIEVSCLEMGQFFFLRIYLFIYF